MVRTLIPHSRDDQPVIDAFHCSECEWSHPISRPVPYELPYEQVFVVCREFERHHCQRFEKRTKTDAA
jgi:hypothetical protein